MSWQGTRCRPNFNVFILARLPFNLIHFFYSAEEMIAMSLIMSFGFYNQSDKSLFVRVVVDLDVVIIQ
jgi:hypothetical protein